MTIFVRKLDFMCAKAPLPFLITPPHRLCQPADAIESSCTYLTEPRPLWDQNDHRSWELRVRSNLFDFGFWLLVLVSLLIAFCVFAIEIESAKWLLATVKSKVTTLDQLNWTRTWPAEAVGKSHKLIKDTYWSMAMWCVVLMKIFQEIKEEC